MRREQAKGRKLRVVFSRLPSSLAFGARTISGRENLPSRLTHCNPAIRKRGWAVASPSSGEARDG